MSFEALLADLDALQKATPPAQKVEPDADDAGGAPDGDADDAAIRAAASGDADQDGTPDGKDLPEMTEDEDEDEDENEDEDEVLGKAFSMTAPDGSAIKAYDGTVLMKGFHQRLSALESDTLKTLHAQTALIKSLRTEVAALQAQGRGRKTVLSIHDKPVGHFASPQPEPKDVLAKALSAQKAGRLTGSEVARVENYLAKGLTLPPDLAAALN